MEINDITQRVIGCIYKVANTLGGGFVEKIYQNAVYIEIGRNDYKSNNSFRSP